MQNKDTTIIILLLAIIIILLGYVAFVKQSPTPSDFVVDTPETVEQEEDSEPVEVKPKPKPVVDPAITLLKELKSKPGTFIIQECRIDNQRIFMIDHRPIDGPATFYDMQGNVLESCGGFTATPTPEDSLCRTTANSCTTVFDSMGGTVTVDTYNLE